MMKKYISLCALCFTAFSFAQNVGIGTVTPAHPLHIDSKKNSDNSVATTADNFDDVVVTNQGLVGLGTLTPKARLDARSGDINSAVSVGTTTQAASAAQQGAIRYNNAVLEYSDGTNWIALGTVEPNAYVKATKSSGQTIANATTDTIINWTETDDFTDSFDPSTGTFTANKDGRYLATFRYELASGTMGANAVLETIIQSNQSTANIPTFTCVQSFPGNSGSVIPAGGSCTGIFNLVKGNTIIFRVRNSTGAVRAFIADAERNTISIFGIN